MIHLPKIISKKGKRVGRGLGSGKGGHTSGRGQKGQKSRSNITSLFEGVKVRKSLYKRLPLSRGKGKFNPGKKPIVVNLDVLNLLDNGSVVNLGTLVKAGIVDRTDSERYGVKILGDGNLQKKLTIGLPISKSAARKVEKAGGKVIRGVKIEKLGQDRVVTKKLTEK
ncbi:50S ribosomal protein L15 [Candidatus Woesebacteria bacterium]|nr:50S ribosomal protein L15 [Candidatus Woesebacteria bacterium]